MPDHDGLPADRVAEVAGLLEQRVAGYDADRDHRAVFAYLYLRLTKDLEAALRTGRPAFDDPAFIAELSCRLATVYLRTMEAVDAWLNSRGEGVRAAALKPGDLPDTISKPWRDVFAAASIRRSYVLEEVIFSMAAHMTYDLPLALQDMARASADGIHGHIGDYDRMNAVFGASLEEVQDHVASRYCQGLLFLEHLFTRDERLLTESGIQAARADAWFNFDRLTDKAATEDAHLAIDQITADLIKECRDPADWKLRLTDRILRRLVPARRQWPH
ncbi:DUF5995 family protein [Kitasatospora sp. NPDC094011]|uniref:DUF5995 family protein n=1 Tax=Kitasatospora sp. NPDC094011 TaxID=3364090 RepID=UPI00380321AE